MAWVRSSVIIGVSDDTSNGGVSSGIRVGGRGSFVERRFLNCYFIFPLSVATDLGKCLQMASTVRPGQVEKLTSWTAVVQAVVAGI